MNKYENYLIRVTGNEVSHQVGAPTLAAAATVASGLRAAGFEVDVREWVNSGGDSYDGSGYIERCDI